MTLKLYLLTPKQVHGRGLIVTEPVNQLRELFDDFSRRLVQFNTEDTTFNPLPEVEKGMGETFSFGLVEVLYGKNQGPKKKIEVVNISVKTSGDHLKFFIQPNFPEFTYSIREMNEEAKVRTEALKIIGRTLFQLGARVLLDSDIDSTNNLAEALKSAKFFILKKGTLPVVEKNIDQIPLSHLKESPDSIEVSVTDQPFAESCYNADDDFTLPALSPFGAYRQALERLLASPQ